MITWLAIGTLQNVTNCKKHFADPQFLRKQRHRKGPCLSPEVNEDHRVRVRKQVVEHRDEYLWIGLVKTPPEIISIRRWQLLLKNEPVVSHGERCVPHLDPLVGITQMLPDQYPNMLLGLYRWRGTHLPKLG